MSNRRRPRPHPRPHPRPRPARPRAAPLEPYVARSEADLVAMVPLALGFHPEESVVVLTFGRAAFHARVDLPSAEALAAGAADEVAEMLVGACHVNGGERLAVVVHTADHARALVQGEALVAEAHAAGLDVIDVLRVHEGRWFEPLRGDEAGTPYELDTHRFTARGVFEGQVVLRDRDELAATLVGDDPVERDKLARAAALRGRLLGRGVQTSTLRAEARWLRERVERAVACVQVTGDPGISTADAVRLLVAVVRGDLRDAAWVDLTREDARDHVVVWRDLVRRAPDELLPSVCGLLALASYVSGDGALAWCALDRGAVIDPDHSLVRLVADVLARAVPPSTWPVLDPSMLPLLGEEPLSAG